MRGTLGRSIRLLNAGRIIPAHAGNSQMSQPLTVVISDHPRACGELATSAMIRIPSYGSSPRMRGTHTLPRFVAKKVRIIPAHAGNSRRFHHPTHRYSDHPRACGELPTRNFAIPLAVGSSPRMRGTLFPFLIQFPGVRIIPAHAGNSTCDCSRTRAKADHPRACGELLMLDRATLSPIGSSPRMRGTHAPAEAGHPGIRIIPAHAGNSRTS